MSNGIIRSKGEKLFNVINIIIQVILIICFLLPIWSVVATSFLGTKEAALRGQYQVWVHTLDFSSYKLLISRGSSIYKSFGLSLHITVFGTLMNMLFTIPLAYGLSKKEMPGRGWLTVLVTIPMFFGGGLIPSFMVVSSLGLRNTLSALIIPTLLSSWNTLLMRNFFMQIPGELEESAMLDGASVMRIILQIIIPLSLPSIATISMFYAVGHWNEWFNASLYIDDPGRYPLQLILRSIVISGLNQEINATAISDPTYVEPAGESLKCAAIVVTSLPMIMIYPFIQKYFTTGIMVGSIKG